jgi:hypothetical protein
MGHLLDGLGAKLVDENAAGIKCVVSIESKGVDSGFTGEPIVAADPRTLAVFRQNPIAFSQAACAGPAFAVHPNEMAFGGVENGRRPEAFRGGGR